MAILGMTTLAIFNYSTWPASHFVCMVVVLLRACPRLCQLFAGPLQASFVAKM